MQTNTIRACLTISGFNLARRSLGRIVGGRRRARTRRELLSLDAHLLRDIGLTHEQVLYGTWPVDEAPALARRRMTLDPNGTAFRILVTVLIVTVSMIFLVLKGSMDGPRHVQVAAPAACTGVSAVLTPNGFAPKDLQYCAVSGKSPAAP